MDWWKWEYQVKGGEKEVRAWGRSCHDMGKGLQIEMSGCKSLALHITKFLGTAGWATPKLKSHVKSN